MFTFRLQRILELREKAEQARAQALASASDAAEIVRTHRDGLAELHGQSRASMQVAHQQAPLIGHLQQLGFALQSLEERVLVADEAVKDAEGIVIGARKLLDDAARERRVLDRLKVRHAEQWRSDEAQKDRLSMDEIALARFSRKANAATAEDSSSPTAAGTTRAKISSDEPNS